MKIIFWGAARNVTGSKHLIELENCKILLDCGFYQGRRSESNQQNSNLPFDAAKIDAVILSHAHLDHCGTLPVLIKNGFAGKIYCTKATAQIAKFILLDSAYIQEQDAKYFNKHAKSEKDFIFPIYTKEDVEKTLEHLFPVDYFRKSGQWTVINETLRFKFYDAGHILGSAVTLLEAKEAQSVKRLLFTGDLGRDCSPILRAPEFAEGDVQTVLSECTYGDKIHKPIRAAINQIERIIEDAARKDSKIIVPAFALGRIQELIYIVHNILKKKGFDFPIYIDSPLAINITEIFYNYSEDFDDDFWKDFGSMGEDPFGGENIRYVRTVEESKALNDLPGPFMVIAASGMAEGGRVLHHLKNNIGNPNSIVLLAGYQAENTLGRRLQDGVSPVRIYGEFHEVKARVVALSELSAHADRNDLADYLKSIKNLKNIFLVHTEIDKALKFKKILGRNLRSARIEIPNFGQEFEV